MVIIYYTYLLRCSDDTLYCGYTNDLLHRMTVHNNAKGAKYTRSRLPVRLVYFEMHETKSDALKREREIKKLPRKSKLELIEGFN